MWIRPSQVCMVHTELKKIKTSDVFTSDVSVIRRLFYVFLVHLAPGIEKKEHKTKSHLVKENYVIQYRDN